MLFSLFNRSSSIFLSLLISIILCSFKQQDTTTKHQIAAEMRGSMVNKLLKQWYPLAVDKRYGGFLSSFTFDFKPTDDQDKMIVTQARHTWSNSKAAEIFPAVGYYRMGAKHGFLFLKNKMWDKQYGGFYTYVDQSGKVKESHFAPKEAYGNSFSIYALAAYYHCSGDKRALKLAIADFMWLEKHSHDPIYKGYYQHMERDGTPIKRTSSTPSTAETGYKDQNTSIHLLEAFTELYAVWPNPLLRTRLREMLLLIRDTIVTPKGYLNLFFTSNWIPISYRDSSESVILKHHGLNHVSFGHDVETAYLMLEASHALGIKNDAVTLHIGKKMLDHALDNGWDNQLGGFYDEGYYFKGKPEITIIADTKNWWAQAEGLNTLLIMDAEYPKDAHHYYEKFEKLWQYVQTYLIDQEHGDWYQGGIDKQPQLKTALKGQIWKGTYHNLRALINCVKSLEPDKSSPAKPVHLTVIHIKNTKVVTWKQLRGNKTFIGFNIYMNNKRKWYTPLNRFTVPARYSKKNVTITAVDLQGNESKPTKIPLT